MPRLDGFGLVRALRADPALCTTPVILLSARAGEEARMEGLGRGADDYLVKPFSARELLVRVGALLRTAEIRREAERALLEEARTLETLNRIGSSIASDLDLQRTLQAVTDAATQVSGAEFGAFFYNATDQAGEVYLLYTLSGAPREAFERFGTPRNTALFAPTFAGEGPVRLADVTQDRRYGHNAPLRGMPEGHLPVRSYLAVPVVSRSGEVTGGLFFGHRARGAFNERSERLAMGIASQAAVAIDNARLHEQRLQLIDQLRDADRAKDEFLATLSHELRNPLAPLRNALQVLQRAGESSVKPIHEMMERQVNHLVRLVDDLMEMSRIARGSFELRLEPIALQTVLRNALETSQPLIEASSHHLDVSLPADPIPLHADAVRLAQVFANLLNNAARYTSPGGAISVTARREASEAVIEVSDTGEGIEPAELARLFEMFSQGNRTSRRSQGGLGIGLALARRLLQMHGGSVQARSEGRGKGSTFTVRLPVATAPGSEPQAAAPAPGVARLRVLVVDDNADAANSLGLLLELLGAEVQVAHDGPGALESFDACRPDLVLLDIGMPGMDGYQVARAIRSRPGGAAASLAALTGWGQEEDRRLTREAGFDHHLVKPADVGALETLLASLTPGAGDS
jgi:signal transduction histidine kinase/DNA-binding response OmpR family regulator